MPYVFLDPDGSNAFGLAVIVFASTGVRYGTQCNGLATEERSAEGFLVLCPSRDPAAGRPEQDIGALFATFFDDNFRGGVTPVWTDDLIEQLGNIVGRVVFWKTEPGAHTDRGYLRLDPSRISACVEAWIPVVTVWGPGILVTDNSD